MISQSEKGVGTEVRTYALSLLINLDSLPARVHFCGALLSEHRAIAWNSGSASAYVHRTLEGVAFPSKDVVRVLAESSPIFIQNVSFDIE